MGFGAGASSVKPASGSLEAILNYGRDHGRAGRRSFVQNRRIKLSRQRVSRGMRLSESESKTHTSGSRYRVAGSDYHIFRDAGDGPVTRAHWPPERAGIPDWPSLLRSARGGGRHVPQSEAATDTSRARRMPDA
jgi:hypothetical protein